MGLGGVAIATLPSVICAKLMFSDGLGGCAVGGGIDVIAIGKIAVRNLGVGMEAGQNRILLRHGRRRAERKGCKRKGKEF